jgi:hypothetical protein
MAGAAQLLAQDRHLGPPPGAALALVDAAPRSA